MNSVQKYAENHLDKDVAEMSDSTGFSPDTIKEIKIRIDDESFKPSDWSSDQLFTDNNGTLQKLIGIMLQTSEINDSLRNIKVKGNAITHSSITRLINLWVSGKDIKEISEDIFKGSDEDTMSKCVKAIYSDIITSTTWGISSFQKLSNDVLKIEEMTLDEQNKLKNIPAMIYYGVNTNEAILLRKINVPRSISINLGRELSIDYPDIWKVSTSKALAWLNSVSDEKWEKCVPQGSPLTGKEYKKIWLILNGNEIF